MPIKNTFRTVEPQQGITYNLLTTDLRQIKNTKQTPQVTAQAKPKATVAPGTNPSKVRGGTGPTDKGGVPGKGDIADLDGVVGPALGTLGVVTGVPGLGFLGNVAQTAIDNQKAKNFSPVDQKNTSFFEGLVNRSTLGFVGKNVRDQAMSNYQDRTRTSLNKASLNAFDTKTYSGPKGAPKGRGGFAGGKSAEGLSGGSASPAGGSKGAGLGGPGSDGVGGGVGGGADRGDEGPGRR